MNPNAIGAQFTSAAAAYAAAIQPYAARLFFALLFIEVLVTAIQYMIDQGDAPRYLGRTFRHLLSAGFIYLMLVNAFPWMTAIMQSFAAIGSAVSGIPNLDPSTVLGIGGQMAETIFNAPTNPGGLVSDLGLVIGQTAAAFFILLSFAVIAALALLVVIEAYLVIGGASILLAFGGSRFTAPIAEGYFGYVIKVGVRLLFFLPDAGHRNTNRHRMERRTYRRMRANHSHPSLVRDLRRSTDKNHNHRLQRTAELASLTHARCQLHHPHDPHDRCSLDRRGHCQRDRRPCPHPRL